MKQLLKGQEIEIISDRREERCEFMLGWKKSAFTRLNWPITGEIIQWYEVSEVEWIFSLRLKWKNFPNYIKSKIENIKLRWNLQEKVIGKCIEEKTKDYFICRFKRKHSVDSKKKSFEYSPLQY
jgi:hypothetical protein